MTIGGVAARREDKESTGLENTLNSLQPIAPNANGVNRAENTAQEGLTPAYKVDLTQKSDWQDPEIRDLKRVGKIECQTCKNRQYQDGSNDPGVSFKAPGHIAPESAAAVVSSHEQEHVTNEQAKAQTENRRVVSQSVRLFTSVCPECGRVYVSGGETTTTTAADKEKNNQTQNPQSSGSTGAIPGALR
ncbi:MAG TPA: hypothetical protein VN611_06225 [Patescibacteria group bacterium]|nr:hypothetical protein [Patescibacteria group bacterium]